MCERHGPDGLPLGCQSAAKGCLMRGPFAAHRFATLPCRWSGTRSWPPRKALYFRTAAHEHGRRPAPPRTEGGPRPPPPPSPALARRWFRPVRWKGKRSGSPFPDGDAKLRERDQSDAFGAASAYNSGGAEINGGLAKSRGAVHRYQPSIRQRGISGLRRRRGVSDRMETVKTALDIAVHDRCRPVEGDGGDRRCGVSARCLAARAGSLLPFRENARHARVTTSPRPLLRLRSREYLAEPGPCLSDIRGFGAPAPRHRASDRGSRDLVALDGGHRRLRSWISDSHTAP